MALSAAIARETENLRHMWDRHSHELLSGYLAKDTVYPQPLYTCSVLLSLIAHLNPESDFKKEYAQGRERIRALIQMNNTLGTFALHAYLKLLDWRREMRLKRSGASMRKLSVLDIGCGSGNYFQVVVERGLHRHIDYVGIDISHKNIENCELRYPTGNFPHASFRIGNIFDLPFPPRSFDVVMVNSVFEHLSPELLPDAFEQSAVAARELLLVNFFYEKDIPEHVVRKTKKYHWNCLSRRRILEIVRPLCRSARIIDKYPFLRERVEYTTSNGNPIARSTMLAYMNDRQHFT